MRFITKDACQEKEEELKDHWDGVFSIPQTHSLHSIKPDGPSALLVAPTSREAHRRVRIREEEHDQNDPVSATSTSLEAAPASVTYSQGEWVLVLFGGRKYPGEVVSSSGEEVEVNVMQKQGAVWRWPENKDCFFYPKSDIIKSIAPPQLVNSRGQFRFGKF